MLSDLSGSLNDNASSINLWVFSTQETLKTGDPLMQMNKRYKQEKYIIQQHKIQQEKQTCMLVTLYNTEHQTDETEAEIYIAGKHNLSCLKHECFPDQKNTTEQQNEIQPLVTYYYSKCIQLLKLQVIKCVNK